MKTYSLMLGILVSACSTPKSSSSSWQVIFADPALKARSAAVSTTLASGSCDSNVVIYSAEVSSGASASPPPSLPPGNYALMARSRDASCAIYATGCTNISLPPPSGTTFSVTLTPVEQEELDPNCTPSNVENPSMPLADGSPSGSGDSGADGGTVTPPNTCVPDNCPGKRCIKDNTNTFVCAYYKSCKHMHDVGDPNGTKFPSGYYEFDTDESDSLATYPTFDAYCDMSTDTGGWTLVGASATGGSSNSFGWYSATAASTLMNATLPYSLGAGNLGLSFTQLLVGSSQAGGRNWGGRVYRLTNLPNNFPNNYMTAAAPDIATTTIIGKTDCNPPINPSTGVWMLAVAGFTNRTAGFFMRDNTDGNIFYGLAPYGWHSSGDLVSPNSCEYNGYLNDPANPIQGMIMVR